MNPTRNIQAKKPGTPVRTRAATGPTGEVAGAGAVAPVHEATTKATAAGEDAITIDVSIASRARSETQRLDTLKLQSLKSAVQGGHYDADPDALAHRIVEDALGPEQTE